MFHTKFKEELQDKLKFKTKFAKIILDNFNGAARERKEQCSKNFLYLLAFLFI